MSCIYIQCAGIQNSRTRVSLFMFCRPFPARSTFSRSVVHLSVLRGSNSFPLSGNCHQRLDAIRERSNEQNTFFGMWSTLKDAHFYKLQLDRGCLHVGLRPCQRKLPPPTQCGHPPKYLKIASFLRGAVFSFFEVLVNLVGSLVAGISCRLCKAYGVK